MKRLLALVALAVASVCAEPNLGGYLPPINDYLPPTRPFTQTTDTGNTCEVSIRKIQITSVVQRIIPTTRIDYSTRFTTSVLISRQVRPTTVYRTDYRTVVDYQTSTAYSSSEVRRERTITSTLTANRIVNTVTRTETRVVPRVSYYTSNVYVTTTVPVYSTNIDYRTSYSRQVQYQTVPVQRTTTLRIPGRDSVRTAYETKYQSSVVESQPPARTSYRTDIRTETSILYVTAPSPPRYSTITVQSQRVIATTDYRTAYQTRTVTNTRVVTQTSYKTETQFTTRYIPTPVEVTRDITRYVVRTEYSTQVVPTTIYTTVTRQQVIPGDERTSTRQKYETSVTRVYGQDRIFSSLVTENKLRQSVVYITETIPRNVFNTRTVVVPCGEVKTGYSYPEPANQLTFG